MAQDPFVVVWPVPAAADETVPAEPNPDELSLVPVEDESVEPEEVADPSVVEPVPVDVPESPEDEDAAVPVVVEEATVEVVAAWLSSP